ncbi:MAG: PQQ-binding-like beta-propeller repeat protein, partial [Candidatus Hydrothermarchaeaceae archaeon]
MNIRFLFFIIFLIPAVSAAECPKNIYYLTTGYVFADGNLIFNFLDMDLTEPQVQGDFVSRPGELVTVEVKWTWGPNCPDCTVYVNSFGTWDPGNDISKLYSMSKGKETSVARVPITFLAPTTPGVYKFRVLFAYDKEYAKDFDASNLCSSEECRLRGECSILIAEGDINVTEIGAGGKKPLSVELTRPKTSAVSGTLKTNVGAVIPIDAKILRPQNTSVNVTVRIDDTHVSDLLPYSWNTFNSTVGSHRILVTVNDENGTIATDEIKVLLQNNTGTFGVIPPIIWGQRMKGIASGLDISEKGSYVVAGSNNGLVYLFDQTGKKIWEYDLSEPISSVAISSDGNNLIFSSGNVLYYLSNNGSMIWTYSTSSPIISTAINADGSRIASASGNVLYYLEKNGSLLWTYSTSSPIISTAINADGSRIASASGNVLYYLEK